ncbi:HNH endonuclease signature motif containing protein [Cryobacterium frigoriphilum]|nr:HNH endonuclease signature motif containing protein [Cryobacterium frigoriphilum]
MTRCLDRAALSSATFTSLSNEQSEQAHRLLAGFQRRVNLIVALSAANIDVRSDWKLGREGLARLHGFNSPEEFVQSLGGGGAGTKADARKLIEAGTLATETETARERQNEADAQALEFPDLPPIEVEQPWFGPLGDAVAQGVFTVEAATAIRRGLGEPAIGVTADMLRAALIVLIPECATLNADRASQAARHMRDRIDTNGIASRADAMRARQYLRVSDRPDGMLHGEFLLDPENGQYMRSFLLQVVGPRIGGPRFTEKGAKARAQSIIDDPRSTDQIAAEALIEAIVVAAGADPGRVFGPVTPSVKAVFSVPTDLPPTPQPTTHPTAHLIDDAPTPHATDINTATTADITNTDGTDGDDGDVIRASTPTPTVTTDTTGTRASAGTNSRTGSAENTENIENGENIETANIGDGRFNNGLILPGINTFEKEKYKRNEKNSRNLTWGVTDGLLEGTINPAPEATIARLICIGGFTPILFNTANQPLDVGRTQRLFTNTQRAALAIRDGGCMMPDCHRPPSWAETHHLHGWAGDNGQTNIDDGILFCKPHHLRIHNDGWTITRTAALDGNGNEYWLIPPLTADPQQAPIRLQSKSELKLQSPFRLER